MKIPHLEPKQRLVALLGAAAVLVLVVVVVVAFRGDDDDGAAAPGPTTTTTADGTATTSGSTDADGDAAQEEQGQGTTTTTAPAAADPGPLPDVPGSAGGEVAPDAAPDGGSAPDGGGAPAAAPDPVGGGEGANVGVVDPDDAQSPPLTLPGTRSEPCAGTGPPAIPLPQRDGPSGDGGAWVTVGSLEGNCGATGGAFGTAGVDTRLVFRSDADQMILFVDDLDDPDAAAGYADVECRVQCAGTRILVNRGGSFRLRVQATDGPWQVELQEYRR